MMSLVTLKQEELPSTMKLSIANVIDLKQCPLADNDFRVNCRRKLDEDGALVLDNFLTSQAITSIRREGVEQQHLAYYTTENHNIYLTDTNPEYPADHPRNRMVSSSKGCITTDQVPHESALNVLYDAVVFREFLCAVLGEKTLHEYADPLSSINLHYADEGQELGWHFDNSSFAITLMIQRPEDGGAFEFVKGARDSLTGEDNFELCGEILDGKVPTKTIAIEAGTLVLFRGRDSIHRVTPVLGSRTRMLVVLAYNTEPGVSLSESARLTFFGRLG